MRFAGKRILHSQNSQKLDPLTADYDSFKENILNKAMPIGKALHRSTGISPLLANEICFRASIDSDVSTSSLNEDLGLHLYRNFERILELVKNKDFFLILLENRDQSNSRVLYLPVIQDMI